jgi:hypothetical protein
MHRFAVMPTMVVVAAGLAFSLGAQARPERSPTSRAGPFSTVVTHPTHTVVRAPSAAGFGAAIRIVATVQSNAPHPTGTCFVQEQRAWTWSTITHVRTTTGTCSIRRVMRERGTAWLRVHFTGSQGWGSSTSPQVSVLIR